MDLKSYARTGQIKAQQNILSIDDQELKVEPWFNLKIVVKILQVVEINI